jgi:Chaperone of endosialidase
MKTNALSLLFYLLTCFLPLRTAQAVSPPPDGLYPGQNVAEGGGGALFRLTYGRNNTALGFQALFSLTQGGENTATGSQALKNNLADGNTADGFQALLKNTQGTQNAAVGWRALLQNTTGNSNTATGYSALSANMAGDLNTANGVAALAGNYTGSANTADGYYALVSNSGNSNIALGAFAGSNLSTGDSNIDIGNPGVSPESNTIRIGVQGTHTKTFVAGISGSPIAGASVVVNSAGRLGTVASSARFKDDIKPMDKASEAILALKPVTFRYKKEIDPTGTSQFGLVAEDVEKINPDLVVRDPHGEAYTVRYEAVNAMLLNEFLKEHKTMQEQGATMMQQRKDFEAAIAQQQKQIEALTATVKEQAAQIEKVSARLELSKSEPQTVLNNQ